MIESSLSDDNDVSGEDDDNLEQFGAESGIDKEENVWSTDGQGPGEIVQCVNQLSQILNEENFDKIYKGELFAIDFDQLKHSTLVIW